MLVPASNTTLALPLIVLVAVMQVFDNSVWLPEV
jgi:hypothetical protein